MTNTLVAYFSAGGATARLAKALAAGIGADIFEIKPEIPYAEADLDWTNEKSRSSLEMSDKSSRPAIIGRVENISQYDTVFIGFPIWWYIAPTIINSFLEQYDMSGKTIVPFASSGSSGMGDTNANLQVSCIGAKLMDGQRFAANTSAEKLKSWAEKYL